MLNSIDEDLLTRLRAAVGEDGVSNYFAGGMSSRHPVIPDNILVWRTYRDLAPERIRSHQRFVFKVVLRGRNTTILDGCRFPLEPGDGILIHPFQFHGNAMLEEPEELYELFIVTFQERFDGGRSLDCLRNRPFHLAELEFELLERLALCYRRRGVSADAEGAAILGWLLSRLAVAADGDSDRRNVFPDRRSETPASYLREHFADGEISLKMVAAHFGKSEISLRRQFHAEFGDMTPGRLLRSLRMQQAAELLCRSEKRIAQVGRECGFRDPFVFSRAFKRYSGYSPAEYRRRNARED